MIINKSSMKEADTIGPVTICVSYCKASRKNEATSTRSSIKLERFTRETLQVCNHWQRKKLTMLHVKLKKLTIAWKTRIFTQVMLFTMTRALTGFSFTQIGGDSCRNFETRKQERRKTIRARTTPPTESKSRV